MDDEERCPCHPFVQLSRRSPRTGEWKSLLDSCPLCVIDGKQRCNEKDAENPLSRKSRQLSFSLPPPRRSRSISSCGSRVRFHPDEDVQYTTADNDFFIKCGQSDEEFRSATTTVVTRAKPALRDAPRYKVCEELMHQQLEDTVKITTMSMGMDVSSEDSINSFLSHNAHVSNEDSMSSFLSHNEEEHDENEDQHEEDVEKLAVEDVSEDEELKLALPGSIQTSTRLMQDDEERESADRSQRGSGHRRRSYQQFQAVLDPKEFVSDGISDCHSQASHPDFRLQPVLLSQLRRQQSSLSQFRSSSSQRQRGRREMGVGGQQPGTSSSSSSLASHHQQEHQSSASSASPPPQVEKMMQSLHSSPGISTRPFYTNMVVSPVPNDDEVSALTFTGHSVRSTSEYRNIHRAPNQDSLHEQDEDKLSSSAANVTDIAELVSFFSSSTMMVDTNVFDPKTGRCIHHPHVHLRKKKVFGKGWKVLMSACPDCCVGELLRIRLAEENSLKLSLEKEEHIENFCRRVSTLSDDRSDGENRSTNSNGSNNRGRGDEGGILAAKRSSNSHSRSVGPLPLPPKKDTLQLEPGETAASLTCSEGSSSINHSKTKKENEKRSKKDGSICLDQKAFEKEDHFRSGGANGAVHRKDIEKEHSSGRIRRSFGKEAGSHLSPQQDICFSSLKDCVEGMGFDSADIEKAIESTGAKSSAYVAKVVEWLAEHHGDLGGSNIIHNAEDIIVDRPHSFPSMGIGRSAITAAVNLTADSDKLVQDPQELRESPKPLEFASDRITPQKEMNRRHSSKSSLKDCVVGMGFDLVDIEKAIETTGAKSSADVAKVVEWLAEHHGQLGGSIIKNNSKDIFDDSDRPHLFRSSVSTVTSTSDFNLRVLELEETLKELGFQYDYIRHKTEIYRRHSSKIGVNEYISAMMEGVAEDFSSSSDKNSIDENVESLNQCLCDQVKRNDEHHYDHGVDRSDVVTCDAQISGAIAENTQVTTADKRVEELNDCLRDLGYCPELVDERKRIYRQYSNTIEPQNFISAMLEVEDV